MGSKHQIRSDFKVRADEHRREQAVAQSVDLAWGFKSSYRPQYGSGLVAEEVPVHFLGYC